MIKPRIKNEKQNYYSISFNHNTSAQRPRGGSVFKKNSQQCHFVDTHNDFLTQNYGEGFVFDTDLKV